MEKEKKKEEKQGRKKMSAKRDFVLSCNDIHHEIKEGDDVSKLNLEEKFLINLKTEKVI